MTKYPLEGGELVEFTPDSLTSIPVPPIFLLRPVTERDRRRLRKLAIREGLAKHSIADLRNETLAGLQDLWTQEVFAEQEGRLRAYWDAYDQYEKEMEGVEEPPSFEHPDIAMMVDLSERITRAWPPLLKMIADNNEYDETWPKLIASIVIAGWKNLDFRYERDEGVVLLDCLDRLGGKLSDLYQEIEGNDASNIPFIQLLTAAIKMFTTNKDEEKNSASPSKSSSTPPTSKGTGKVTKAGSSTAKSSSETPAT